MANPGLNQAKNRIDDIASDPATDSVVKLDSLTKLRRYLNQKIDDIQKLIAANPPSATNVPAQYDLCVNGKVFAKFEDGVIKPI